MMIFDNTIAELWAKYLPKKLASCSMTNCGWFSGIQCPEFGTVNPVTFLIHHISCPNIQP
jgi:hypothetical protein